MRFGRMVLPQRFHKRTLVIGALALAAVLLVGGSIFWRASRYLTDRDVRTFAPDLKTEGQPVAGIGLNVETMPPANLVANGSFDRPLTQSHFLVSGGSSDTFTVTVSDGETNLPLTESHFDGATFRLIRFGSDRMTNLHEGRVDTYTAGRILDRRDVALPANLPASVRWNDMTEYGDRIVAAGTGGYLLNFSRESGEAILIRTGFEDEVTSVVVGIEGIVATDRGGRFLRSEDGLHFDVLGQRSPQPLTRIVYRQDADGESGFYLACGEGGTLWLGRGADFARVESGVTSDINDLIVPEEGPMYAVGDDGVILVSHNGLEWQADESLDLDEDWLSGDGAAGAIVVAGRRGCLARKIGDRAFERIEPERFADALGVDIGRKNTDILWPDFRQTRLLTSKQWVTVTTAGTAFLTYDGGETWDDAGDVTRDPLDCFARFPSGTIALAFADGRIGLATFGAVFRFEPAIEAGEARAGDYVLLDLPREVALDTTALAEPLNEHAVASGEWLISGNARASFVPVGDRGGDTRLRAEAANPAKADPTGADPRRDPNRLFSLRHRILNEARVINPMRAYHTVRVAQKIDLAAAVTPIAPGIIPVEFDLRVIGPTEGPIEVWLSGPGIDVAEEISADDAMRHHRLIFVLPRPVGPGDDLWLNIGCRGNGGFELDNVWLGRVDEAPQDMPHLMEQTAERLPPCDVIRLGFVPIGRAGFAADTWLEGEGASTDRRSAKIADARHHLGTALRWTESLGAVPWLVIDARADSAEITHLLEYMAGSQLTPYGRLRVEDGDLGKWSDVFGLIYVEIADRADIFASDRMKAQRVQWVIDCFRASPYYAELQKCVIFLDGMDYDETLSHADADYHTAALNPDAFYDDHDELHRAVSATLDTIPLRPVAGAAPNPLLLRSVGYRGAAAEGARLADKAALLLETLGLESTLNLLDCDPEALLRADGDLAGSALLACAHELTGMTRLQITEPATPSAREEAESKGLALYSFRQDERLLIFAVNAGRQNGRFILRDLPAVREVNTRLYDYRGRMIREASAAHERGPWSVLPGGMLVLDIRFE